MEGLIEFVDTDGRKRKGISVICEFVECTNEYLTRVDQPKRFCSRSCSSRKPKVRIVCSTCENEFERSASYKKNSKSGLFFCSKQCKDLAQRYDDGCDELNLSHYTGIGNGTYRKRALVHYGEACMNCKYDEHVEGLDVHHRDEDRTNNVLENLMVLCGTCHNLHHRGII